MPNSSLLTKQFRLLDACSFIGTCWMEKLDRRWGHPAAENSIASWFKIMNTYFFPPYPASLLYVLTGKACDASRNSKKQQQQTPQTPLQHVEMLQVNIFDTCQQSADSYAPTAFYGTSSWHVTATKTSGVNEPRTGPGLHPSGQLPPAVCWVSPTLLGNTASAIPRLMNRPLP